MRHVHSFEVRSSTRLIVVDIFVVVVVGIVVDDEVVGFGVGDDDDGEAVSRGSAKFGGVKVGNVVVSLLLLMMLLLFEVMMSVTLCGSSYPAAPSENNDIPLQNQLSTLHPDPIIPPLLQYPNSPQT